MAAEQLGKLTFQSALQVGAQRSDQCCDADRSERRERRPAIVPLATERKVAGAERGRCLVKGNEHQANDHGLPRKKSVVE